MMDRPAPGSPQRWPATIWAGAAGFYLLIALCFFRPVWGSLSTRFIGDGGDNYQFIWNAWWVGESLLKGKNPWFCTAQFAPQGVPLVLHTLAPIPSAIIAGLSRGMAPALAYNVVLIGLYPLAGLCAFALARRLTRSTPGALVGGLAFMICPFMASKSLGHLNLLCAGLLPLFMVCLLGGVEDGLRRRWAILGVWTAMLFSNIHTTIFAGNVTLWYFIYRGLRSRQWRAELRRFWDQLQLAAAVSLVWGAFVLYYALRYHLGAERFGSLSWCPELLSFLLPIYDTSAWRHGVAPSAEWDELLRNLELAVYLGWLILPMAIVGWWSMRKDAAGRFMAVLFVCAMVLAAGQKVQWKRKAVRVGGVPAYLPMGLYRYVPVLGSVGQSGRYMVIGYMAIGVGVAGAVAAAGRRWGTRTGALVAGLMAALIAVDYAFVPVAVAARPCPIPPGPGRVMDPRLGDPHALYWQTLHRRELVGGYVARIPRRLRAAYASEPGIGWFFQSPEDRGEAPSRPAILGALDRWDIRYVFVQRDGVEQQVLRSAGLKCIHQDDWAAVFSR